MKVDFLLKLATTLHNYGASAQRLEKALGGASKKLGLNAQFFSTPTMLIATFKSKKTTLTRLVRVRPGGVHLEKLVQADNVGDDVIEGRITPQEGLHCLDAIENAPSRYPALLRALCFGGISASASTFFGASWQDLGASFIVGLIIGLYTLFSSRLERLADLYETICAFIASILAMIGAIYFDQLAPNRVTLAGLIVLVPGLTLTVAMSELATQNLVSGTARLMGSATVFLKISFGAGLGLFIGKLLGGVDHAQMPAVPGWVNFVLTLMAPFFFTVLFEVRPRDVPWVFLSGMAAVMVSRVVAINLGGELATFAAGACVSLLSNLLARIRNTPSSVTLVPGIILLVPGSLGYQALLFLRSENIMGGVEHLFKMLVTAVALVSGIFVANLFIDPKRSL